MVIYVFVVIVSWVDSLPYPGLALVLALHQYLRMKSLMSIIMQSSLHSLWSRSNSLQLTFRSLGHSTTHKSCQTTVSGITSWVSLPLIWSG